MDTVFEFLRAFMDFFFAPLYAISLDNQIYVILYVVVITLAVYGFVRRLLKCVI